MSGLGFDVLVRQFSISPRMLWAATGAIANLIPAPCGRGAPASVDLHRQQTGGLPWPEMGKNLAQGVLLACLLFQIKLRGSGLQVAEAESCTRHCHLAWAAFRILDTLRHTHELFLTETQLKEPRNLSHIDRQEQGDASR